MTFLDTLRDLDANATPGPWFWNVNRKSHSFKIMGAHTRIVMDLARWGMASARPRFRHAGGQDLMVDGETFAVDAPGREHHRAWYQDVHHPDADMLVFFRNSAPAIARLVEASAAVVASWYGNPGDSPSPDEAHAALRAALTALNEVKP